jgi:hypothetical protein
MGQDDSEDEDADEEENASSSPDGVPVVSRTWALGDSINNRLISFFILLQSPDSLYKYRWEKLERYSANGKSSTS